MSPEEHIIIISTGDIQHSILSSLHFTAGLTTNMIFAFVWSSSISLSDSSRPNTWLATGMDVTFPQKAAVVHLFFLSSFPDPSLSRTSVDWFSVTTGGPTMAWKQGITGKIYDMSWAIMYVACEIGLSARGLYLFPDVCVSVEAHEKCSKMSFYSDILISCSRHRQRYTKCTPTCIISTASPLVTSPFPQPLSITLQNSKTVKCRNALILIHCYI